MSFKFCFWESSWWLGWVSHHFEFVNLISEWIRSFTWILLILFKKWNSSGLFREYAIINVRWFGSIILALAVAVFSIKGFRFSEYGKSHLFLAKPLRWYRITSSTQAGVWLTNSELWWRSSSWTYTHVLWQMGHAMLSWMEWLVFVLHLHPTPRRHWRLHTDFLYCHWDSWTWILIWVLLSENSLSLIFTDSLRLKLPCVDVISALRWLQLISSSLSLETFRRLNHFFLWFWLKGLDWYVNVFHRFIMWTVLLELHKISLSILDNCWQDSLQVTTKFVNLSELVDHVHLTAIQSWLINYRVEATDWRVSYSFDQWCQQLLLLQKD